jgi:hypothetical protein
MSIEMNSGGSFHEAPLQELLRRGNQQYFNEKPPVNLRVALSGSIAAALPAQLSERPLGRIVAKPSIFPAVVRQSSRPPRNHNMLMPIDNIVGERSKTARMLLRAPGLPYFQLNHATRAASLVCSGVALRVPENLSTNGGVMVALPRLVVSAQA